MVRNRPIRIGSGRVSALLLATALGVGSLGVTSLLRSPGAAATTYTTSNLLAGDQANFDGGTTGGWSANNASLSNVSSPTQSGAGALAVTSASTGDVSAISGAAPATWTAAVPGAHYTGSLWVQAAGAGRTVAPVLVFYSSSGATVGSAWGQASTDQPGSWTTPAPVVGIAPANAAYAALAAMIYGTSAGEVHYLDTASLTRTSYTSANLLSGDQASFDGGTTGGWSGNNASVSSASSPTQSGPGALAVTSASTGDVSAISGTAPATWTPAVPGDQYTGSLWLQAAQTGRTVASVIVFYSSSGATVGSAWGQASADQPGSWSSPAPAVGVAPTNTAYAALAVMIYGTAANEVHYLDTASLTRTSSSNVVGPLRTSGNVIFDGSNHPITLRGLNRPGMETSPTPNISESDIDHAKQWGANFIRVPLAEPFWLSNNCHYDPTYASKVDSMVNWITSRGMVALLDLHTNTLGTCGPVMQQMMADYPGSITFWNQVAARYKSNNLVAFDLYNEPHDISDSVWRSGGYVNSNGTVFRAAGMQQLYNAVRSQGATNLVVASGTNWGFNWPSTAPLKGNNIVYGVHAYTCPLSPPPNCSTPNYYDPSSILNSWVGPSASNPVMVTEFGWPDHFSGIYNQNVINFAEAHNWGWVQFAWDGSTSGTFDLLADVGANYEPAPAGMPALAGFAKN